MPGPVSAFGGIVGNISTDTFELDCHGMSRMIIGVCFVGVDRAWLDFGAGCSEHLHSINLFMRVQLQTKGRYIL